MANNPERKNHSETVLDVVVARRVEEQVMGLISAEQYRQEAVTRLVEIANIEIATPENVKVGDFALYTEHGKRHSRLVLARIDEIRYGCPLTLHGFGCGKGLDEIMVITQEGKVLVGKSVARFDLHYK